MFRTTDIYKLTTISEALYVYKEHILLNIEGISDIFVTTEANKKIVLCNNLIKTLEVQIKSYNDKVVDENGK